MERRTSCFKAGSVPAVDVSNATAEPLGGDNGMTVELGTEGHWYP